VNSSVVPFRLLGISAAVSLALLASWASAQPNASANAGAVPANAPSNGQAAVEEVIVFGRNTELVGKALTASEGSVGGADLLVRPMFKTSELLESMPGMVAVQHSGSGKANQFFLRGFNLDHGTDYTAIVDGMPWNLRSHGHGQGYLDVNGLIPETVDRIDYRKGPYRADLGDFAVAGASFVKTIDSLDDSFLSTETGQYGWRRLASGSSHQLGVGNLLVVGEYKQYDGPWESGEDLEHYSLWSKYITPTSFGQAIYTLSAYKAGWNPTEQIPERAFGTAVCEDEFCSLDNTASGGTKRAITTAQLQGSDWDANLYAQFYDWSMLSNPTYDFQIGQFDRRWTVGGGTSKQLVDNGAIEFTVGGNFRYDDGSKIGVSEYNQGLFVAPISDNSITEGSLGVFAEGTWHATDSLRLMAGLRGDYYDFDVVAFNSNSAAGQKTARRASPKVGLAFTASDNLELYANWGKGFHSNDARGVVNPTDPIPGLSPGEGYEFGGRVTLGDMKLTAAYWWLDQSSELIFVGDSNSVEPKGASEREGLELTMFWQPTPWLGIDAVYTESDARFVNNPEGPYIEDALEEAAQVGITASLDTWDLSLRARYMGPYALTPDNAFRADPMTMVSLRGAHHWDNFTAYAEVINALDTDDKEIVYLYPAYVAGLDPAGLTSEDIDCSATNCRMSRSVEPRTFRVGVSYKY
jgi:outer membrane receptor protein involved in Fe transport